MVSRQGPQAGPEAREEEGERGKWGSHLVGVVKAVVHEPRDERRLPDCKAEREREKREVQL